MTTNAPRSPCLRPGFKAVIAFADRSLRGGFRRRVHCGERSSERTPRGGFAAMRILLLVLIMKVRSEKVAKMNGQRGGFVANGTP